ncbi:FtsX-like permease family protein [Parabacteroides sp. OttesenSCG-928-N08]|nr:FtsX-like permease family protein [Parabacteroides sp. OttesenSCG-928-N08]
MIRHIATIIWNERRVNSWIVLEYILVFSVMWYCCDYLYYTVKCRTTPIGFDIDHVYRINIGERQHDEELSAEEQYAYATTLLQRLKQYPAIENASISSGGMPYGFSESRSGYIVNGDTTLYQGTILRHVSSEFFDLFRVDVSGRRFDSSDPNESGIVVSMHKDGFFGNDTDQKRLPFSELHTYGYKDHKGEMPWHVVGETKLRIRTNYYRPYESSAFYPIQRNRFELKWAQIAIRVKPSADRHFAEKFRQDMREQLNIGPYFFQSIIALNDVRAVEEQRYNHDLNSVYAITAFLIINIFLGVIGTFWYRTQTRRSEVGLRLAMGATRRQVRTQLLLETFLLLLLSSLLGAVICLNIAQTDLLDVMGLPQSDKRLFHGGWSQYVINYVITFLFLLSVSFLAVWYPARQAAKTQPAESLRDE